jgi:hypothetical protein
MAWVVFAIELTIKWNRIRGVYVVNSTGQLIPFVIGIAGILKTLFTIVREHFKKSAMKKLQHESHRLKNGQKAKFEKRRPHKRHSFEHPPKRTWEEANNSPTHSLDGEKTRLDQVDENDFSPSKIGRAFTWNRPPLRTLTGSGSIRWGSNDSATMSSPGGTPGIRRADSTLGALATRLPYSTPSVPILPPTPPAKTARRFSLARLYE